MLQAFRTQPEVYGRYWARAYVGWPRFTTAAPSAAHRAFTTWESAGTLLHGFQDGTRTTCTFDVDGKSTAPGDNLPGDPNRVE